MNTLIKKKIKKNIRINSSLKLFCFVHLKVNKIFPIGVIYSNFKIVVAVQGNFSLEYLWRYIYYDRYFKTPLRRDCIS